MNLKVLFFGAAADSANRRNAELKLEPGASAEMAFSKIVEAFPRLRDHKLLFAVNQEYTGGDTILKDGDEFAVFTAVSGG